jgi:hypothetical protein
MTCTWSGWNHLSCRTHCFHCIVCVILEQFYNTVTTSLISNFVNSYSKLCNLHMPVTEPVLCSRIMQTFITPTWTSMWYQQGLVSHPLALVWDHTKNRGFFSEWYLHLLGTI